MAMASAVRQMWARSRMVDMERVVFRVRAMSTTPMTPGECDGGDAGVEEDKRLAEVAEALLHGKLKPSAIPDGILSTLSGISDDEHESRWGHVWSTFKEPKIDDDRKKHFEELLDPKLPALKDAIAALPDAVQVLLRKHAEEELKLIRSDEERLGLLRMPIIRTGVLAQKIGMMGIFDRWGERHCVTVVRIPDKSCVTHIKTTPNKFGYIGVQVGGGLSKRKHMTLQEWNHCFKRNLPPFRKLVEFRVHPNAVPDVGTPLTAMHFRPGQLVDVSGISIGHGFQGVMKRHGFGGQCASHGTTKKHRSPGSIGNCQDPGRVWKGKKMPGHMGNVKRTVQNLKVLRIDPVENILFVRGSIPGRAGNWITVRDAIKALPIPQELPIPTHVRSDADPTGIVDADVLDLDPFEFDAAKIQAMQLAAADAIDAPDDDQL